MEQATYIGMDLGTFKTSATSSNGRRAVVQTAVGWPKDHVAKAMLGRDVIFGEDIREHRMALQVVRPFEKGVLKYNDATTCGVDEQQLDHHREAARLIVEHAVALTEPTPNQPVYGVIGAPSRATALNKRVLLEAASRTFDAVFIVPEPFTVAFGMNRLCNALVVDIGAGTIDICPMYGAYPAEEDQVTIPRGGDAIDERFESLLQAEHPQLRVSRDQLREIKEKHGFVHDVNDTAVVTLRAGGRPVQVDVTKPLKIACKTIVQPIVDGVEEVISRLDTDVQQALLANILLGGGGSQLKGLDRQLEESLKEFGGATVSKVYDSVFAGAVGALKLAMCMPPERWETLRELDHVAALDAA
jgi:rod shape-determining protein MreB